MIIWSPTLGPMKEPLIFADGDAALEAAAAGLSITRLLSYRLM